MMHNPDTAFTDECNGNHCPQWAYRASQGSQTTPTARQCHLEGTQTRSYCRARIPRGTFHDAIQSAIGLHIRHDGIAFRSLSSLVCHTVHALFRR